MEVVQKTYICCYSKTFKMKELLKRSITGALYVFLLLAAVFLGNDTFNDAFNFLFLVFGLTCLYEFKRIIKLRGYHIFLAFLVLWWLLFHLLNEKLDDQVLAWSLLAPTLAVNIFLIFDLFSKKERVFNAPAKFVISLLYLGAGCIFLTLIPYQGNSFAKFLIFGIFILMWVNDSFAYLVGKSFGKTKLFERISPKKTIEGFIGGFAFSLVAAYFLYKYTDVLPLIHWLILATVTVILGSIGDLIESKFKRKAGVKDSGAILPGHGGLLDRLDSLVFAAPFIYLTLQLFNYVS